MATTQPEKTIPNNPQTERLSTDNAGMQTGYVDNLNTLLSYFKHLLSLVFPLTTLLFLTTGLFIENEAHSLLSIFVFTIPFWIVLLLDWRCPKEKRQASTQHSALFFDGILAVLTALQLINVLLMLNYIGLLKWDNTQDSIVSLANLVAIRFLVGTSSGTSESLSRMNSSTGGSGFGNGQDGSCFAPFATNILSSRTNAGII